MTASDRAEQLARIAARAADDKLATDVVAIDVSDHLVITDIFLVASATNERQVGAIVEEVEARLAAAGSKPVRREGERDGRWVLLDYVDIVVHVQHTEERSFYGLDRLWKDCPMITLPAPVPAAPAGGAADPAADPAAEVGAPVRELP